jgi:endonuclease-3
LISLVVSSQTKDQITHAAMDRLREHGCTAQNLLDDEKTPISTLEKLIYPVGFYKRKAQYIKRICKILVEQYNAGDIPYNIEDLLKLPGVGPKMAYLCMSSAWNNVVGIGVDTHVHRISNRLGWVKTNSPEATRKALEEFVPRELWDPLNVMLVGFGQTVCKPVSPSCANCSLLKAHLCPYGIENWDSKKRKSSSPKTGKSQTKKRTSRYEPEEDGKSGEEDETFIQEEGSDTDTTAPEVNNTLPSGSIDMEDMFIDRRITRSMTNKQREPSQY